MHPADLIVLVADANMKAAIEGLLLRKTSLGLTQFSHQVLVHPHRDPGCRLHGHEWLRTMQRRFRFALLMFDLDGCGAVRMDRTALEAEAEARLSVSGWKDRSAAIVIAPELEIWVWADSPWVDRILAWEGRSPALRPWLASEVNLAEMAWTVKATGAWLTVSPSSFVRHVPCPNVCRRT